MSQKSDWLPAGRDGQLSMAKDWKNYAGPKAAEWGIPNSVIQELSALIVAAGDALAIAKNEASRTPVANAQCRAAFEALTVFMRDMKRRPLTRSGPESCPCPISPTGGRT